MIATHRHISMVKVAIVWTAPRSLSSVIYQSMTTLQGTQAKCFFELYMYPYCFGSDSTQCPTKQLPIEPMYSAVNAALLQDYQDIDLVFSKEMAKCLPAKNSSEYVKILSELAHAHYVFLIRDPAQVVYSRYKVNKKKPTGFEIYNETDAGLMKLYDLYYYVQANFDSNPTVIDASDLQNNPSETMKTLCKAIGVTFESHMIKWEPDAVKIEMPIEDWAKYFDTLSSSTGIIVVPYSEQTIVPMDEFTPAMVKYVEDCRPHYEILRAKCLKSL